MIRASSRLSACIDLVRHYSSPGHPQTSTSFTVALPPARTIELVQTCWSPAMPTPTLNSFRRVTCKAKSTGTGFLCALYSGKSFLRNVVSRPTSKAMAMYRGFTCHPSDRRSESDAKGPGSHQQTADKSERDVEGKERHMILERNTHGNSTSALSRIWL